MSLFYNSNIEIKESAPRCKTNAIEKYLIKFRDERYKKEEKKGHMGKCMIDKPIDAFNKELKNKCKDD